MVKQERPTGLVTERAAPRNNLDGAIAAYREAVRLRPDFLQAHRGMRNALRSKGDVRGAQDSCRQILRLSPGDAEAMRALDELIAEEAAALQSRAAALAADGNIEGAAAAYREVVRLRPGCAEAHGALGALLVAQHDFAEAAHECRQAIRLRPDLAEAHFNLGNALAGVAAAAPAPAAPKAASVPDVAAVPLIPAPAASRPGDEETRTQDGPVGKNGHSASSVYRVTVREGNLLAELGDLDGAAARYREAVRLKPDVPEAHNNLGVALRRKGDFDAAIAAFQAAVRLKPDAAETHNNLAVALRSKGDFPSAIVSSREAVRLNAGLAPGWYNLACAYALAGDSKAAAEGLRQAIGLDVKFRELARREPDLRKVRRAKEVITWLGPCEH
jgi:tetratricopeptide (TPR) repeat protein